MQQRVPATAMLPVSYLFVPGSRADRFEKAIAAGADRVIIDLEDAVDVSEKEQARESVRAALLAGLRAPVLIRVNSADSPWFDDDLRMLGEVVAERPDSLAGFVLPKLESAETTTRARGVAGEHAAQLEFIGLIESAVGVQAAAVLAASGVTRLGVGAVDLAVDLGSEVASPVLDVVYAQVAIASRAAGIAAPIGSPPLEIHDAAGIEATARALKAMGVTGQLCIHPAQLAPIHIGHAPSDAQLAWARRVLDSVGGSVQVDGQMVDKPVRDRAEHLIGLASRRAL